MITAPTILFLVGYFRKQIMIMGTIKIALAAKTLHMEEGRRSMPNLSNKILAVKISPNNPDLRIVDRLISRIFFQKNDRQQDGRNPKIHGQIGKIRQRGRQLFDEDIG